jgi:hypothetical protein
MADDSLVFVNGQLVSAQMARMCGRLERDLAAAERDLLMARAIAGLKLFRDMASPEEADRVFRSLEKKQMPRLMYRMTNNARR